MIDQLQENMHRRRESPNETVRRETESSNSQEDLLQILRESVLRQVKIIEYILFTELTRYLFTSLYLLQRSTIRMTLSGFSHSYAKVDFA